MDQDQISQLPKTILYDILSRLPRKYAARTSVLSKAWAETWYTFPILSFSYTQIMRTFPQPMEDHVRKKNFLDYVRKTLLRFSDQRLAIKEFKLIVNCFDFKYMSHDVDLWMKLARESGVEVIDLCLYDDSEQDDEGQGQCYILPMGVLEAKSLKKLELGKRIRIDQALLNHSIKFSSLRVLSLSRVLLGDEHAIEHLISHCALLEYIALWWCHVLKPGGMRGLLSSISMRGLPKLKRVEVIQIQEVYIDASNLEKFWHCPSDFQAPCKIDFDRCRNLRKLYLCHLWGIIITDKWFLELFIKFPFLERLKLLKCTMSEKINISSGQLKCLALSRCSNLEEVNIDAPNLSWCHYNGDGASKPIISLWRSSSQLEVKIDIHSLDICGLRELIQNIKPQNVLTSLFLSLQNPIMDVWNPDVFQLSFPPPSIKHLDLSVTKENETYYLHLVNGLLSSCRPAIISLTLHPFFCRRRAFIEFFYETLMGRKEEDCFCSSGHTKCWWHGLKDLKVISPIKTDEYVDFKTMLDSLETCEDIKKISFILEF